MTFLPLAFLIVASNLRAQIPVTITADTLFGGVINGLPVQQYIGHMQFVQGSLYGSADKAIYFTTAHRMEMTGNVAIHQDTLALYAPHVIYNDSTSIGYGDGGVRMFDRDQELTAHEGDYNENTQIAHFFHHVTVTQGKNTSLSDSMTYYRSTETSILYGHASVTSDSGSLTGDTITNVRALGETIAKGSVHLANDSLRLASDWLFNSQLHGELHARGNVAVEDIQNNTTIFGDTLARFSVGNYLVVPKRPLLLYIDSSQVRDSTGKVNTVFDTMFVRADTMKLYQGDSARFIAIDSVRLYRSNFSLSGGKLVYDQIHDIMSVFQAKQMTDHRQHIWNDSTEIDADSVSMLMKEHHINKIYALGHAFATSPQEEFPNSGRIDQLEGDNMLLIVRQDTARELYDMSSALSIHFLTSDEKPDGLNRASGDTIRMDFQNRKVVRIAVISGTEGEYFPERFVKGRAKAFHLTAYERHDNLRPHREEFVLPTTAETLAQPAPAVAPASTPPEPAPPPNPSEKPKRKSAG